MLPVISSLISFLGRTNHGNPRYASFKSDWWQLYGSDIGANLTLLFLVCNLG